MPALITLYRSKEAEVGHDSAGRVGLYVSGDYARHLAGLMRALPVGRVDRWAGDEPVAAALDRAADRVSRQGKNHSTRSNP
jgi:hypothetical protein